jgi:hypothetical protein
MSRWRARIGGLVVALILTLPVAGCGDDSGSEDPAGGAPPSSAPAPHLPPFELPPEFRDCMANEGMDIPASGDLPADIDPEQFQEPLQACGELLHP